jgi:hypothetical protein
MAQLSNMLTFPSLTHEIYEKIENIQLREKSYVKPWISQRKIRKNRRRAFANGFKNAHKK